MAGVRFWMSWLALVICGLIVRQHPIGLVVVGSLTAVWVACAIYYLARRVSAGARPRGSDGEIDIDLLLCIAALVLSAIVPVVLLALQLHIQPRQAVPLILALAVLSFGWKFWSQRRKAQ